MREEKKIYFPLFASKDLNGGYQSDEESRMVWDTIFSLDKDRVNRLLSQGIAEALAGLEENYQLSERLVEYVTVTTREMFFGKVTDVQALELIRQELKTFSGVNVETVIQYIQQKIFMVLPDPEVVEEEELSVVQPTVIQTKKLQVLQALSEYPGIGNQILSEARIKVKSQPEPVRGSVSNWIRYYRDELGIGQHSTVERGQFLFRSENGLKLADSERERLNLILKSLEENLSLDVDPDRQMIVFPVEAQGKREALRPVHDIPGRVELPSRPTTSSVPVSPNPNMQYGEVRTKPTVPMTQEVLGKHTESQPAWAVPSRPSTQAASEKPFISQPVIPQKDLQASKPSAVEVEAERLKREPKPDWIKGAFTKESIPEKTPDTPVAGNVSFSFNHALPAEQEVKQVVLQPQVKPQPTQPRQTQTFNQFHIRPVSMRGKDDLGQ